MPRRDDDDDDGDGVGYDGSWAGNGVMRKLAMELCKNRKRTTVRKLLQEAFLQFGRRRP